MKRRSVEVIAPVQAFFFLRHLSHGLWLGGAVALHYLIRQLSGWTYFPLFAFGALETDTRPLTTVTVVSARPLSAGFGRRTRRPLSSRYWLLLSGLRLEATWSSPSVGFQVNHRLE